nr:uncharacterized protein LOC103405271 [Malus domestica]
MCKPKSEGGLGFKDLYAFNLALLTKQGWRIIKQPQSLLTQVFKARYFQELDFLHALVKSNSSYYWKNIVAARVLIYRRARRCVADGLKIKIWGDSWLLRENYAKVLSPVSLGVHLNLTVRSLMLEADHMRWNMQVVSRMFFPEEVNLILSIPLSFFNLPDELIWIKEPKGVFMTKSAYFVARTCNDICMDVPVGFKMPAEIKFLWKALWCAKVSGKIKICIWRGCLNALPTTVNLKLKKVVLDGCCIICGTVPETIKHIMLQCPHARATWFASLLGLHHMQQGDVGLQDWVARMAYDV